MDISQIGYIDNPDNVANFSEVPSSTIGTAGRTYCSQEYFSLPRVAGEYPEETIILTEYNYEDDDFYQPPLLNEAKMLEQVDKLNDQIARLEKRKAELTQQAALQGSEKAVVVLFNHRYSTLLNLLETNKQVGVAQTSDMQELDQVVNGTSDDEHMIIDIVSQLNRNSYQGHQRTFGSQSTRPISSGHTSQSTSGQSSLMPQSETNSTVPFVDELTGLQIVSTLHMQTKTCTNKEERLKIGSKDAVQISLKIAMAYPENERVEEDICGFLNAVAMTSKEGCSNVLCVDSLNYLHGVFNKHWENRFEKKKLIADIVGVFFHCSYSNDFVRKLRKDRYIELLLKTFQTDGFDNYDILCGVALIRIMQYNGGRDWIFRMSKRELENIMTQGMKTWVLGLFAPVSFDAKSFSNKLKDIRDESVLVQQLNSWLIANATENHPERYCALLREVQGVEMLEMVLTDIKCDPLVVDMVTIALTNVKKTEGLTFKSTPKKEKKGFMKMFN